MKCIAKWKNLLVTLSKQENKGSIWNKVNIFKLSKF